MATASGVGPPSFGSITSAPYSPPGTESLVNCTSMSWPSRARIVGPGDVPFTV